MKFSQIRWLFVAGAVGAIAAGVVSSNVGCGSDSGGKAGTSGGGSTGSAGTSGTAGTSGGGTTGTGGSGVTPRINYTFDTATSSDSTSWKLNDYIDGVPAKNLGAYMKADAGLNLANPPSMQWASDDSEGGTSSGSMKITVTFSEFGQYVDPVYNLPAVVDLSNRTMTMKIRLVSGTFSTGGVQFHFGTGSSYVYSAGAWVNGTDLSSAWKILSIDTSTAVAADPSQQANFDPSMVIQVGVQIGTGGATDGGVPAEGPLVFEIDTVKGDRPRSGLLRRRRGGVQRALDRGGRLRIGVLRVLPAEHVVVRAGDPQDGALDRAPLGQRQVAQQPFVAARDLRAPAASPAAGSRRPPTGWGGAGRRGRRRTRRCAAAGSPSALRPSTPTRMSLRKLRLVGEQRVRHLLGAGQALAARRPRHGDRQVHVLRQRQRVEAADVAGERLLARGVMRADEVVGDLEVVGEVVRQQHLAVEAEAVRAPSWPRRAGATQRSGL